MKRSKNKSVPPQAHWFSESTTPDAELYFGGEMLFVVPEFDDQGFLLRDKRVLVSRGDYIFWLVVEDGQGRTYTDSSMIVTLDHSPPDLGLNPPTDESFHFMKSVKGDSYDLRLDHSWNISDLHLASFSLSYSSYSSHGDEVWTDLGTERGIFNPQKIIFNRQNPPETFKVLIKLEGSTLIYEGNLGPLDGSWHLGWNTPSKKVKEVSPIISSSSAISLKLQAKDVAGNTTTQQVQLTIPRTISKHKDELVYSGDKRLKLYLPANTLRSDQMIHISSKDKTHTDVPFRRISPIYKITPYGLELKKVPVLTIIYDPFDLSTGMQPILLHRSTNSVWKVFGGTFNFDETSISAGIQSLGEYTVGEIERALAISSARLVKDSLSCQPRVFSPLGNSLRSITTISFHLDNSTKVTIKVYDVAGRLTRLIAQNQELGVGSQAIDWDGRDNKGQIVPTGLYIITVTAGGQTQTKVVNVWNG